MALKYEIGKNMYVHISNITVNMQFYHVHPARLSDSPSKN